MNLKNDTTSDDIRIVARYSSDEIELSGTPSALDNFAQSLVRGDAVTEIPLAIPEGGNAAPFDGFLLTVIIEEHAGKVLIKRHDAVLRICGSTEYLEKFSRNIQWFAKNTSSSAGISTVRDHIHIEYHPDHFYLDPSSDSLIVVKDH